MNYETEDYAPQPAEITLSNGKLFLIFVAAALVCGAFFGLGYSMGRRGSPTPIASAADVPQPTSASGIKPSASSNRAAAVPAPNAATDTSTSVPSPDSVTTTVAPADDAAAPPQLLAMPQKISPPPTIVRNVTVRAAPVEPATPVAPSGRTYLVQVAAVSHQADADMLVSALHRKGYQVVSAPGTDALVHVQVGPFATQKDAAAMRDRLASDGYNAIVK